MKYSKHQYELLKQIADRKRMADSYFNKYGLIVTTERPKQHYRTLTEEEIKLKIKRDGRALELAMK